MTEDWEAFAGEDGAAEPRRCRALIRAVHALDDVAALAESRSVRLGLGPMNHCKWPICPNAEDFERVAAAHLQRRELVRLAVPLRQIDDAGFVGVPGISCRSELGPALRLTWPPVRCGSVEIGACGPSSWVMDPGAGAHPLLDVVARDHEVLAQSSRRRAP